MGLEITQRSRGVTVWRLHGAEGQAATLDPATLAALAAATDRLACDRDARALVIEGSAGHFCRGMDLPAALALSPEETAETLGLFAECLDALRTLPLVVLAVIEGDALGGGLGLACAADVVLCTKAARLGCPEVLVGLVPGVIMPLVIERCGLARARALSLALDECDGPQAMAFGLVDGVHDDVAALERAVTRVLRRILRADPRAIARCKAHLRALEGVGPLRARLQLGVERTRTDLQDARWRGEIAAVLEGELPPWSARLTASTATIGAQEGQDA